MRDKLWLTETGLDIILSSLMIIVISIIVFASDVGEPNRETLGLPPEATETDLIEAREENKKLINEFKSVIKYDTNIKEGSINLKRYINIVEKINKENYGKQFDNSKVKMRREFWYNLLGRRTEIAFILSISNNNLKKETRRAIDNLVSFSFNENLYVEKINTR